MSWNRGTGTCEIIGHRGCEGLAQGNSLDAFEKAIEIQVDRVEFDVQELVDGRLIVFHDKFIQEGKERTPVASLDRKTLLATLQATERSIPLLETVLKTCKGRIPIQLEMKAPDLHAKVHQALLLSGFPLFDVTVSAFNLDWLVALKDIVAEWHPAQLVFLDGKARPSIKTAKRVLDVGIGSISIPTRRVTKKMVRKFHDLGLRVLGYGVGDLGLEGWQVKPLYRSLVSSGIDGFTCAYPEIARQVRDRLRTRH